MWRWERERGPTRTYVEGTKIVACQDRITLAPHGTRVRICFLLIAGNERERIPEPANVGSPCRHRLAPSLGAVQAPIAALQSRSSCRGLHIPPAKALPCVPV